MKSLFTRFFLVISLFIFSLSFAQITKNTFKVKGECGMCKDRIETTAKKAGATSAQWNAETQILTMDFNHSTVTSTEILKKIAEAGNDNEQFKTTQEVYDALPGCCHYDRDSALPRQNEISTVTQAAQSTVHQVLVKGNCESCKARIEQTALEMGAKSALWLSLIHI